MYIYTHVYTYIDRGSSVKAKHSFVRELSNIVEFEYVWPLISDWRPCGGRDDSLPSILLGRYLGRSYLGRTKSKSKAKNRHGPYTVAKSETRGHTYSNSTILLNSRRNESFTFTELPRSIYTYIYIYIYIYIYLYIHTWKWVFVWVFVWECVLLMVDSTAAPALAFESIYVHLCTCESIFSSLRKVSFLMYGLSTTLGRPPKL